jgi:HPt (histidine-containing phosphotransfer) domain-containing protein
MALFLLDLTSEPVVVADSLSKETQVSTPLVPPVDLARLQEMAGDNPEDLHAIVDLYLAESEKAMGGLRTAIRAGEAGEVEALAHKLGGSSAMCGMTAIIAPLLAMEKSNDAGHWPEKEKLLREADRQRERIRAYLTLYLPQTAC